MQKDSPFDWVKEVKGNNAPLFFMLGPCAMEDELSTLKAAEFLGKLSEKLKFNLIFKGSFDKANRTSISGFRGVEMSEGLKILAKVRQEFGLPVMTDVHETAQVAEVAEVVDILQIPAFLCRQTDLLCAAGKTGKPVHVKKGQFEAPEGMKNVVGKIESVGNKNVWLCERGYTFGYRDVIVDYRGFPIMKQLGKPIVFDATHSVQRPGGLGSSSGGDRTSMAHLAAAAVSQGIAGLFIMVHPNPDKAFCCGPVSVSFAQIEELVTYLINLDDWIKSNPKPKVC